VFQESTESLQLEEPRPLSSVIRSMCCPNHKVTELSKIVVAGTDSGIDGCV
jgi:hypothetical protein